MPCAKANLSGSWHKGMEKIAMAASSLLTIEVPMITVAIRVT